MKYVDGLRSVARATGRIFTRRRIIVGGVIIGGFLIISPIVTYMHFSRDIANRQRLMNRDNTGIIIKDRNGEILYNYGNINGYPELKLEQISDHLEQAVIASEDQGFYDHEGYSLRGISRAIYANLINRDPVLYGGSTITQQLVKNKLLGKGKNYYRKYQEVTMAVAVEQKYSKKEIMEMYLNSVYFGEGAFGIAAAADKYFDKPAQDLTVAESAVLVGLLPAPSAYSPISGDKEKAEEGQDWVLSRMADNGYISQKQKEKADKAKLAYAKQTKPYSHAQHFVMMVLNDLKEKYGEENIARQGFEVTTSLDLNWQKQTEQRVKDQVEQIKRFGADNASVVAIDPRSGEVRVLVGSVDWNNKKYGKVNMAATPRQPGSSFKPIYYTKALDEKLVTAATILKDEPKKFGDYEPQNFDFKFRGDIPLRHALAQSLNIPSIEVMQKLGVTEASKAAQEMGLSSVNKPENYGLSLALGTAEVEVLNMTHAYSAFANQGEQHKKTMVTSIEDKFDEEVFTTKPASERIVSPEASFLISSILSDNEARAPTFGSSLNIDDKQAAVKTGTTDDSKDAWTMGYTPDLSVGVWVGNNRHKPMEGLMGSTSAGAIWRDTVSSLSKANGESFKPPSSVIEAQVCSFSAFSLPDSNDSVYKEFFIKGTEPNGCQQEKDEEKKNDKPKQRREEDDEDESEGPSETEDNRGNDNRSNGNDRDRGGRGGGNPDDTPIPPEPEPEEPPDDENQSGPSPSSEESD